jgi:membrane protein YqaA with SNARE-associated domain
MDWTAALSGPFEIDASTWWTAVGSAFLLGFVVGAFPAGAAELIALAVGALPSAPLRAVVLAVFTAGHVVGKLLWYWLGTLEAHVTERHLRAWIDRARSVAAEHPRIGIGVTFAAAVASAPPFHLVAIAAGIVRAPVLGFAAIAFIGRLLRFSVLAAFPALLRYLVQ